MQALYWLRATYLKDGKKYIEETVSPAPSIRVRWERKIESERQRQALWAQFPKRGWNDPPVLVSLQVIRPPAYLTQTEKMEVDLWQRSLNNRF